MAKRKGIDLKAVKKRLEERRDELRHLTETSEESRRPVELDQTRIGRLSRMDALQDQAMQLETGRRREIELKRTDAALERLAEGDYGICVNCGEEIAARRLELDPTSPVCIDCAEAADYP